MPLTMAEIREQYPNPIRHADITNAMRDERDPDDQPPCYCVAGAFLLATGQPWHGLDDDDISEAAMLDEEVTFPSDFGWTLARQNPRLCRDGGIPPFWADGNDDMAGCYESAIVGANDFLWLNLDDYYGSKDADAVPDHFDLAWQLLDDALTYDPATFDATRALRLLKGGLMKIGADDDYFDVDRPELIAYRARHIARYRELLLQTQ
jgi:hypothetical protein